MSSVSLSSSFLGQQTHQENTSLSSFFAPPPVSENQSDHGKLYLRHYPESDRTYIQEYRLTEVKDGEFILRVPDDLQETLVLHNFTDSPLVNASRKVLLTKMKDPHRVRLCNFLVHTYGEAPVTDAMNIIGKERMSLYSPEHQKIARLFERVQEERRKQREIENDPYFKALNGRNIRGPLDLNFKLVAQLIKKEIDETCARFNRQHPLVSISLKVTVVTVAFFFCIYGALCLGQRYYLAKYP